ncbi:related to aminotriazole resistance protein [Cephalotrichum gorgonifer]|uniref:Related to aminotriazole resistance protein n=1 Tax=Cephalotrichum gorgonifer TaxID=2041049 RepID=A0AAE8SZ20_9PEZI|nr:related to aminotriazole resistance protein [Cephalotrichum gorgonifer]
MAPTRTVAVELTELPARDTLESGLATPSGLVTPMNEARTFAVDQFHGLTRSRRVLIMGLVIMVNLVQFVSNFTTVSAGFTFSELLGRDVGPGQANWLAAAYSLTQGAFVLISGRLGTIYGHQRTLLAGAGIFTLFTFMNAWSNNYVAFIAARALTGVGGGILMPNCVATITLMVPPGRWRNVALGCFGASAPVGGYFGGLLAALFTEVTTDWKWLFIFLTLLQGSIIAALYFSMPVDQPLDKNGKIDFVGSVLGLSSLILFGTVWNQAPSAGWEAPYLIAILILSLVLFGLFLYWEGNYAKEPVMPLTIFKTPTFTALIFVVVMSYMGFAVGQWYTITWLQQVRGWSVMDTAVGYTPFIIIGPISVAMAAWFLPRMAAQWILAMGIVVVVAATLLIATMPEQQTYWAQAFPAIILSCLSPDFVYVAAQLIASNSVGRRYQGVAGSLIGTLNLYGNSLGIGFAGTIESQVMKYKNDHVLGLRSAVFFGCAIALVALVMDIMWVRVPKDNREGWETSEEQVEALVVGTGHRLGGEELQQLPHRR